MIQTIFLYEWKKLKQSASFWLIVFALLCIGFMALINGRHVMAEQRHNIHLAIAGEDSIFTNIVRQIQYPDTATEDNKWRYSRMKDPSWSITSPDKRWTTYWMPKPMSELSIGNRDVYPYYHEIEPYSFYMRFFKSEISNPFSLLIGNIDLAFVIIYLLPLFLIAFTFSLQSSEIESGTFALLSIVNISTRHILLYKTLFYYLLSLLLLVVLMLAALFFVHQVAWGVWLKFSIVSGLYLLIWTAASYCWNRLKRSSLVNIISLLCLWVLLLVVLPSTGNAIATVQYPVNAEVFSDHIRRVQLKYETDSLLQNVNRFLQLYPQYKKTDTSASELTGKAYIAKGVANDIQGDVLMKTYVGEMLKNERFIKRYNICNPAMLCQLYFNKIVETDLDSYLQYMHQARQFTQDVKMDLVDKLFRDELMTIKDFKNRKKFRQVVRN